MEAKTTPTFAKEIATKINALVNIPLIREEDEQIFLELIVTILLDLFLSSLNNPE